MICGFCTMYHLELLTCFAQNCLNENEGDVDDDDNTALDTIEQHIKLKDVDKYSKRSTSSSSSGDGHKYNQNMRYPPKQYPVLSQDVSSHISEQPHTLHLNNNIPSDSTQIGVSNHNKPRLLPPSSVHTIHLQKPSLSKGKRPRVQNDSLQISKQNRMIQPISINAAKEKLEKMMMPPNDDNDKETIHEHQIPAFNGHHSYVNNEELDDMIDDMTSQGLSDSVYFENEWYDENASKSNANSTRRSSRKRGQSAHRRSTNVSSPLSVSNITYESHLEDAKDKSYYE